MAAAPALAAEVLAEAFAPDPLMRHAFGSGDAPAPRPLLERLLAVPVAACAEAGGVVSEADGAAAWLPAERWPPAPGLAWRAGYARLPARLPPWALLRLARHERGCAARLRAAASGAGYLWLIGIRPAARGRGLGRALLERACDAMAERFRLCLLKTENPDSLAFYRRCGFVPRSTLAAPSGLTVWVLERPLAA